MLKKFSFAAERVERGVNYKVWQDNFHSIELSTTDLIEQKLQYIHNNPVADEIVFEAEDYKYSSAHIYTGKSGVLDIAML